jgi:hypothetical protein
MFRGALTVGRHDLEEHDRVPARIAPLGERLKTTPSRHRKSPGEFGDPGHRSPVRCRVGQKQDHPVQAQIALLGSDLTLERLNVVEARLGFDEDPEGRSRYDDVRAAQVTRDRDRDLSAPAKPGRHSDMQPLDQSEMGSIADRRTSWVKTDRDFEAEDRGDLGHKLDRERPGLAALDPADHRVRHTDHLPELPLTQSGGHTGDQELSADPYEELTSAALAAMDGAVAGGHARMVISCAYLPRTWGLMAGHWNARCSNRGASRAHDNGLPLGAEAFRPLIA